MDVISGMATMAMAIPTISFGHRYGHFWLLIRPQMAKISQIYAYLVIWPYLQYPYDYGPGRVSRTNSKTSTSASQNSCSWPSCLPMN